MVKKIGRAWVIPEKCIGCEICIPKCPFDAITMVSGIALIDDPKCTGCGLCVKPCPTTAIELEKFYVATPATPKKAEPRLTLEVPPHLENYKGVFVFVETARGKVATVSWELLGKGKELAGKLGVPLSGILLGQGVQEIAREAFAYGADAVYLIDDPLLKDYRTQPYSHGIVSLVKKYKPEIVLFGATTLGRDLAGAVATELETGLTADCTGLDIQEGTRNLLQTRPAFGGNIMATILCKNHRPQMATVRPRVMKMPARDPARSGQIIEEKIDLKEEAVTAKLLEFIAELGSVVHLEEAEVIVSGGRGIGAAKNFNLIEELAHVLGGTIGASRKAVEAGWIDASHQVGQTGKTVRPRLYIACGISGAIQHLVGMQTSDFIVAINKNPEAPIFKVANIGVVGDVLEIIPALTEELSHNLTRNKP